VLPSLAVIKGLLHRTHQALLVAVLVHLEAVLAHRIAEGLAEPAVGVLDDAVRALHGDETGHLLEELDEALLGPLQKGL
jgi:hypothetical protein